MFFINIHLIILFDFIGLNFLIIIIKFKLSFGFKFLYIIFLDFLIKIVNLVILFVSLLQFLRFLLGCFFQNFTFLNFIRLII
jgi:hypothetical protein